MTTEREAPTASDRSGPVIDSLLKALGESFDLDTVTSGQTLGDSVRQRLSSLDIESPPSWGTEGSIAQVAKQETGALDFYYRPHLFPDMSEGLRLAHHLQFDLLPRTLPPSCPLEIAAVLESYCHLSGDLIGWDHDEHGFFLWIADVAGHGVRAGLAAAVMHFLMSGMDRTRSLSELAGQLNERMLAARNPDDRRALFVTAFMLRVTADGRCRYASGGHPPMMVRRGDGEVVRLLAQGPPIGLLPEQQFSEDAFELGRDDGFFLYTDGLLEARSPRKEEFGLERIEAVVRAATGTPLDLSRAAYARVRAHKDTRMLDDDLTFLAARLA